ncbi:MAG: D-glycero-beta-D-manno-heptose-7-phosphate kinase [Selenomonadaceae bacterium]|nr:D-glycero-beta-D-manno-heptose-7-phosphate kinase [Selenomonadaceae bacterium]
MNNTKLIDFIKNDLSKLKVLVLGDVMLDIYYYGEVKRISPEAPVPVTHVLSQKETLGGAANVAHNLALLGVNVNMAGFIGDDEHGKSLANKFKELGADTAGLIATNSPTTAKIRVIGSNQQMLRLDFEETKPPKKEFADKIKNYVTEKIADGVDAVIISDYAKGLVTEDISSFVIQAANDAGIPAIVDPKGVKWEKYKGADFITPNLKELNEVTLDSVENVDAEVEAAAYSAMKKFTLKNIIVTRSSKGMSLVTDATVTHIRATAREVYDVSGAGDTIIAVFSAAIAGGLKPTDAAYLSNLAASVVVGKLGTYALSREELLEALKD